jgi:hypothetical protein
LLLWAILARSHRWHSAAAPQRWQGARACQPKAAEHFNQEHEQAAATLSAQLSSVHVSSAGDGTPPRARGVRKSNLCATPVRERSQLATPTPPATPTKRPLDSAVHTPVAKRSAADATAAAPEAHAAASPAVAADASETVTSSQAQQEAELDLNAPVAADNPPNNELPVDAIRMPELRELARCEDREQLYLYSPNWLWWREVVPSSEVLGAGGFGQVCDVASQLVASRMHALH